MGEFAGEDSGYAYKLRGGGRTPALIVAFMLVVEAIRRRVRAGERSAFTMAATPEIAAAISALAVQIVRYVQRQMRVELGSASPYASALQGAIYTALQRAAPLMAGAELEQRVTLIVTAETQRLTAIVTQHAAAIAAATRITRTAQPTACDRCQELAGVYSPPYPAELWYTHPHCACSWRIGA